MLIFGMMKTEKIDCAEEKLKMATLNGPKLYGELEFIR